MSTLGQIRFRLCQVMFLSVTSRRVQSCYYVGLDFSNSTYSGLQRIECISQLVRVESAFNTKLMAIEHDMKISQEK